MIFKDLSGLSVKFSFDSEDEGSGWVELQLISDEESKRAVEKFVSNRVDYHVNPETKRLERLPFKDTNIPELQRWSIVNGIVDWFGIEMEDVAGNIAPLPCTDENKVKLYRTQPVFKKFVDEKWAELKMLATDSFGGTSTTGNSSSTQSTG